MNALNERSIIQHCQPFLAIPLSLVLLWGCTVNQNYSDDLQNEVVVLAANAEVLVGENRFSFALFEQDGQTIDNAIVSVQFVKATPNTPLTPEANSETLRVKAEFRQIKGVTPHIHPNGSLHLHDEIHGFYVLNKTTFDVSGIWQAQLEITDSESLSTRNGALAFEVLENSRTLMPGERGIPSINLTSSDVENISEITTHSPPLASLYALTVSEALERQKPLVLAFSTPSFCLSRTCGPVTDVVAQTARNYTQYVDFIHIEPWNLDLARQEGLLHLSETAKEWRLPSEPWVFVIDSDGFVSTRFDGVFNSEELIGALERVLNQ